MNRGRHRSRKPVEGQTGHAVSGTPTTTTTISTSTSSTILKLSPIASSSSASVVVPDGASNSLAIAAHQQLKNLQPSASNPSAAIAINRIFIDKENVGERMQDTSGLSILSSSIEI
ncbi:growth-regulating factor 6 [Quercus suber]|uniref:Growth-regulating factor 6 n=1 Tax=Quercus suber TaxID=58331 RepID=A0AAW0LQD2_QUESU|nr:growth-regulating factor 6 [Quercus suber]